jgi:predicted nucleic acid-binding protein
MTQVVLDTTVVVALVDSRDKWHAEARAVAAALKTAQAEILFLQCRRSRMMLPGLFRQLHTDVELHPKRRWRDWRDRRHWRKRG